MPGIRCPFRRNHSSHAAKDSELLLEWLKQIKGTEVKMIVPERGFKRKLKDMAMANAKKYLSDKKLQWEYQDAREQALLRS